MLSGPPSVLPDGRIPVLISAHAHDLVAAEAAGLAGYLRRCPLDVPVGGAVGVQAVAQTLRRTRPLRAHRALIRARDTTELLAGLDAVYRHADHPLVTRSDRHQPTRTAFVFPGQGTQWPGMGADLLGLPAYRDHADRCDSAFRRAGRPSPLTYLAGTDTDDPVVVQGAQFAHAVALAATWRHFGVLADVTVGHSLGELAAAHTAGAVDLDDAVAVVIARAELTHDLAARMPGRFAMAMLALDPQAATDLIAATPGWLELAVVNGPESVVVSGATAAVHQVLASARQRAAFARELSVRYPAHTSALEALRGPLIDRLPDAEFHSAAVEFIGSTYGGPNPSEVAFGQYWFDNLRRQVRFDQAVAAAVARGVNTFIEMSAHPTLLVPLADIADSAHVVGSAAREHPADTLAANIAAAMIADPGYRWRDLNGGDTSAPLRHFPHAPMHTSALWARRPCAARPSQTPTVMTEQWQPAAVPPRRVARTAVVDCAGHPGQLAARLAALAHANAAPADAEQLILIAPPTGDADIATTAHTFADYAARQLAVRPGAHCRRVWLITCGADQLAGDHPPDPGAAALAALHRCTGFDYPDHTFAHLDLPTEPTDADLRAAVTALAATETEIAVRCAGLWVRRLQETPLPPARPVVPHRVVISGGTGAIGMAYAAFCADHGAGEITLISRRGAIGGNPALEALRRRTAARITAIGCDLTDEAAVAAVVAHHAPAPAGLVVHTASAPAVAATDITEDQVRDALGAKVIGLDNLLRHWPQQHDARVLVCSSVLALWGGTGHGMYAAANRMADVLVARLRAAGRHATSIRWGLWETVAVVSGAEKDRIARTGLTPMAAPAAITAGLLAPPNDPAILAADFDRLAVFFGSQGVPPPFGEHAAPSGVIAERSAGELVAEELAAVLGLPSVHERDMHRALIELGVDSLLALDLRNRLGRATGKRVPLGALLTGMSAAQLVATLQAAPPGRSERTLSSYD